jgi:UDP-N-acetylmuramoyl-L-alanyl-D-glutamate--2,6-diaminopimelate ligase
MNLQSLLSSLQGYELHGFRDVEVSGISYDSRQIQSGYLFAGLPGQHHHGIKFLAQAQERGASSVLTDRKIQTELPLIVAKDARLALASVSSFFFDQPSTKLKLIGVTGTNGKTTTTYLLQSIFEQASIRCGVLGTIRYSGKDFSSAASLTTPESVDLQKMLANMVREGCGACVMEVSSHSLVQHRVARCIFEAGIFTNLTQDHLDYHKTMEEYFQAKRMLFSNDTCTTKVAINNQDDPYGQKLLEERKNQKLEAYSFGTNSSADFYIKDWSTSPSGSHLTIRYQETETIVETPLIARYNAYNVCGAFAAATARGIDRATIAAGVRSMKQVPGRLEKVEFGQPYLILIDYAHTEDALRQLLHTVRGYTKNRMLLVFGCGGERDRGKRPVMGRVAAELADEIILTSDNPRNEDPDQIIRDVMAGIPDARKIRIIPDREEAIGKAIEVASTGDALVLAGKGHENYQIIGTEKLHFDEREILAKLLTGVQGR